MKHRAMVILLVVAVAVAAIMATGLLVQATEREADLGGPVVVTPRTKVSSEPTPNPQNTASRGVRTPGATPVPGAGEPTATPDRPTPTPTQAGSTAQRENRAEPVAPPSPRPGGGDDDDDDDDGGDSDD
ncbi:hypothetical protein SAMN05421874_105103 [Nonomuraea maritima]|uniref:Uncharacterized protein n=1 Tax=Nonomuraea maritima TaxID=683260 RepID=A0A1G8Z3D6_9ACTN|nr:hypothetical protein [Nonomuraea maritima]SDK09513.1 hypothetical protein SAMN05421874_105103 [Nonomuraea maritima]